MLLKAVLFGTVLFTLFTRTTAAGVVTTIVSANLTSPPTPPPPTKKRHNNTAHSVYDVSNQAYQHISVYSRLHPVRYTK
jgi:hypothetical protein